jgi:predicted porin
METNIVSCSFSIRKKPNLSALAAGALLCGGVAHAQSSITLYGVLDAGLLYASHYPAANGSNAGHIYAFNDSGTWASSFGLRGVEDLGGGTRMEFRIESGVSLGTGAFSNSNKNAFGRQTYLSMDNDDYGKLTAGVQFSPFFRSVVATDPRGASFFFGSAETLYVDNVFVTGMFNSNAITYDSPKIAGLQGSAMIALGGEPGNFAAGRQYAFRLAYDTPLVHVDAAMYNGDSGGTAASTPAPSTTSFAGRTAGVKFHFGQVALGVDYALYKVTGGFSSQVYGTGFNYQMTPAWNLNAGAWYTHNGNNSRDHSILVATGVAYFLSKETTLYTQFGFVDNHGKMNTGFIAGPSLPHEVTGSTIAVNVGVRHTF